ncbi:uncharacterized protein MONBRDRAFT_33691 [Monosiga brevicollis MX1]|uniref:KOW domain-containing protein n=1 Tax=Monosiga brevicollis TaxID=81824 RepID=A9V6W4_MONBE|nr:uncharacterized protein MONBRDRAFT_33691 [Monosiga brevicollis MX1]EDQ86686.1 predicted protein [Monosiga brevicollis MX1]|eukprot:XP_001748522.1 hypothetical protein [Monosiga brevicollis MX1]
MYVVLLSLVLCACVLDVSVFRRFVEVGRVVLINAGPDAGKLAVIVDCIDEAKVLIDGPCSGVARQPISYRYISLTDFKIDIVFGMRSKNVAKAYTDAGINEKWEQSAWAKKLALRKKRASLTDFERFVVKVNKQKRNLAIKAEYNKLKKSA